MKHRIDNPETTTYAVAHNGDDIAHLLVVHPGNSMATGQPYLDTYDTESELFAAWPQLEITALMPANEDI